MRLMEKNLKMNLKMRVMMVGRRTRWLEEK